MGEAKTAPLEAERREEIEAVARAMFGREPARVAFPGGSSRSAFIADMGGEAGLVVLAKRDDERDAQLEATVLKGLSESGHTPGFVARKGRWIAQECLPGPRLPVVLDAAEPAAREARVAEALEALLAIQEAARVSGLVHRVAKLGVREGWFADRAQEINMAAKALDLPPAELDIAGISKVLDVRHRDFVKWDARPGNALILPEADGPSVEDGGGRSIWFDWEDCGRHDAMDDIVCLLADEWCMLEADAEERLLASHLERFAGRRSADAARHDFVVMALVQTGFRLRLAAGYYARDRKFWNRERCLAGDKVGVTASEIGRLIARGRRLAPETALTRPYLPLFDAMEERLGIEA